MHSRMLRTACIFPSAPFHLCQLEAGHFTRADGGRQLPHIHKAADLAHIHIGVLRQAVPLGCGTAAKANPACGSPFRSTPARAWRPDPPPPRRARSLRVLSLPDPAAPDPAARQSFPRLRAAPGRHTTPPAPEQLRFPRLILLFAALCQVDAQRVQLGRAHGAQFLRLLLRAPRRTQPGRRAALLPKRALRRMAQGQAQSSARPPMGPCSASSYT